MKTSQVLRKARRLIAKPERWTKHAYAEDGNGFVVSATSPRAKCFCAVGAVARVCDIDPYEVAFDDFVKVDAMRRLAEAAKRFKGARYLALPAASVNDSRHHADVLRMFDSAIRLAERQEAKGKR